MKQSNQKFWIILSAIFIFIMGLLTRFLYDEHKNAKKWHYVTPGEEK